MYGIAVMLVLGSGFLHSVWNLYTKKSINKSIFLWFCQLAAIVIFLPWTVMELYAAAPVAPVTGTGIGIIALSMALHGMYVILLAAAYSIGDLSQVYPIMRGTSPLLVPCIGVLFINEKLTSLGWLGVAFIVMGIILLSSLTYKRREGSSLKAPLLALAVGVCIACYIIVDKLALAHVSPVVLNEATNIGNLLALSWAAFKADGMKRELKANWRIILLGGLIAPAGYLLFLFALSLAPVAQLAPMREIGTVFGTIMGIFILKEAQGRRRLWTSVLITLGVILLGIWG